MCKKLIAGILILASVCIAGFLIGQVSGSSRTKRCYALTTQVIVVDRTGDLVYAQDFNGMVWSFYGTEDWEIGDCCSLLMDSMDTAIIYDDQIINARYSAWEFERR